MKDKFLKMAGVKTEKEFYSLYPDEASFFAAFPEAQEMKKGGNVPTNPQLYSRVKSEAKQKFDRWPSAYGSAWLVKTYKSRGGGYRKAQDGMEMPVPVATTPVANSVAAQQPAPMLTREQYKELMRQAKWQQKLADVQSGQAARNKQERINSMLGVVNNALQTTGNVINTMNTVRNPQQFGYGGDYMQDGGMSIPAMMNTANYADAVDKYTGTNPFQTFAQGANFINAMQPQESEGNQSEIAGLAMQALPGLMDMAEGGKMPAWLAKKRFAAAGNEDQLSSYGYAKRGGDIMFPMMMAKGGQPCYECGGSVRRMDEGGEPDGEMALGQIMAMHERLSNLQKFIQSDTDLEPWVSSKITLADDYLNAVSDYLQYGEDNSEYGLEAEQEEDYNMGEMEEMKNGGIPQRYKNMGFNKVGVKKKSTRPGKKWMVLAKKGDKYKVVHGGYKGMKDFSQHGSEKRKDNFWNRMGGKNSAKATDPFSPLYWHKRFGTWQEGGAIPSMDYDFMKQGGIYINPANKGKFTESANRAGMGVQEFARHVLANKEDYSATQVKRANFARNAAKWKKQMGGQIGLGDTMELDESEVQRLMDMGYGVEYVD